MSYDPLRFSLCSADLLLREQPNSCIVEMQIHTTNKNTLFLGWGGAMVGDGCVWVMGVWVCVEGRNFPRGLEFELEVELELGARS